MYGQQGILSYDAAEDKVQCHICGKWFRGLNNHVLRGHGWDLEDYRQEFSLNKGQSLICEGTRAMLSHINKTLGNWRHLVSQTMTKDELKEFLQRIRSGWDYNFRRQTLLQRSERLKEYNPMNTAEAKQRSIASLKQTWYGSKRMRSICRANMLATIAKQRQRNLDEKKWRCTCGQVFAIREDLRKHKSQKAKCS